VLFSRDEIALYVNRYFEPAWESVRPVPIVRIDFGNGTILTRTLHGNIATHVCTAEGQVLDTLGGIYTPAVYLEQLTQFRLLANYVDQQGKENRAARLRDYHRLQAETLRKNEPVARFVDVAPITKRAIENNLKAVLVADNVARRMHGVDEAAQKKTLVEEPRVGSAEDLANWKLLAEDTQVNESLRRRQIHEELARCGLVRPEAVTKWLYREVLHADLDDPYLGLGSMLFASYPFKDSGSR
jgi:hypothetical protein